MAIKSPEQLAHEQWIGYIQPEGLVVSIPALLEARAHINQNFLPRHRALLEFLPKDRAGQPIGELPGFLPFAESILGWSQADIAGSPQGPALHDTLQFYLRDYGETLQPKYALRDFNRSDSDWLLLIDELPGVQDFDTAPPAGPRQWQASPQARFERLLRETKVPAGLLVNQQAIRLVYAPRGESSGLLTFRIPEMTQVAGRPLFAALDMLLSADRLFVVEKKEQLPAILAASRKYQNVVSTRLAEQVMAALYELLRGFQSAQDQSSGQLLEEVLANDPNQVYQGLLTVLLRLVFILFAEDRGLLSTDPIYTNHYGIGGLFERLRADAARYPDTMNQRFGAWAQLLTLFRLIYDGGSHGPKFDLPARRGYLFDPSRYAFLEGRQAAEDSIAIPRISDGVLHRVLENLLILDGERLSYRNLDVEQIGSVYEAVMGFTLEVAAGPSIAITSPKKAKGGAPVTINLEELLRATSAKRAEWLQKATGQKLAPKATAALKSAASLPDLLAALDRKIEKDLTPTVVPAGSMIFQPSPERRRSGSHYTPRSLTSPIVEAALSPVLQQLGPKPTPEQILDLKICDPAMGSGAFLVQVCRQLGEHLLDAWRRTDSLPPIPPDEDELLHARRTVAQRCLYGVDRNDTKGVASPLSEMHRLIAKDPRNAERIFPYIGGEEVNDSPTHAHHRYVINFEDFPLRRKETGHSWFRLTEETQRAQLREGIVAADYPDPVAADWPDLLAIVEARVKPERLVQKDEGGQHFWWRFLRTRPNMKSAIRGFDRILAVVLYGPHLILTFLNSRIVLTHKIAVFAMNAHAAFGVLQSRCHEAWARTFSSTLKDDLAYAPSDCFETFPLPSDFEKHPMLESTGQAYYDFRAALMVRNHEGLTKTYNRFHDPGEMSVDIVELP